MIDGETRIRLAWAIAKMLDDAVVSGPEGNMILAMAFGIFVEGQDGSHRDMQSPPARGRGLKLSDRLKALETEERCDV